MASVVNRREADFVIRQGDEPYIYRWWVIPRNRWFNIYLHGIVHDDEDRALHDHPWVNLSFVLDGEYREIITGGAPRLRSTGSLVLRRPTTLHRLELVNGMTCWSLFITGPKVRIWGFQCPRGWIPFHEFVDPTDNGKVGKGCGE